MKKILIFILVLLFNIVELKSTSINIFDVCITTRKEIKCIDNEVLINKLSLLESSNDYESINRFGYMGKYQFGRKTLKGLIDQKYLKASYEDIETINFIKNKELQEQAMQALIIHNTEILENYKLMKYIGQEIGGVKITLNGMLAASHLRGPKSVKKFILSNGLKNDKDGNNTSVKTYMLEFKE